MSWLKIILGAWLISPEDAPVRKIVKTGWKFITGTIFFIFCLIGGLYEGNKNEKRARVENVNKYKNEQSVVVNEKREENRYVDFNNAVIKDYNDLVKFYKKNGVSFKVSVLNSARAYRDQNLINTIKDDGFVDFPKLFTADFAGKDGGAFTFVVNNLQNATVLYDIGSFRTNFLKNSTTEGYCEHELIISLYHELKKNGKNKYEIQEYFVNRFFPSFFNIFQEKSTGKYYTLDCFYVTNGEIRFRDQFTLTYIPTEIYM